VTLNSGHWIIFQTLEQSAVANAALNRDDLIEADGDFPFLIAMMKHY